MLAAVQPSHGEGGISDLAGIATADHVPRTRVDSGHVVDADGIIRRLPKLAIRNRTSDDSNDNDQAIPANWDTASENERSAPESSNSSQRPMSNRSRSDESVPRSLQSLSQRQSADSSKLVNASEQATGKKKRGGGMRNFLTLKEPSAAAWSELAKAEDARMKQINASGAGTAIRPMSKQKLPDFVPKVNSKWDGLPDSAHKKSMSMNSKAANRANRISTMSNATRDTTWTATSRTTNGSTWTDEPFAVLSGRPVRDSVQSNAYPSYGRPSSSQGSEKQPPALALVSDSEPVENTEDNRPQTFLRDSSPPPSIRYEADSTPLSPPELEANDIPYYQELDAEASGPSSPITPPADGSEARPVLAGIHYPELDSVQKEADLYGSPKVEAVARANSSRRPVNFSRLRVNRAKAPPPIALPHQETIPERNPSPLSQSDRGSVILSPTLKTPTGNIEPFLTDTFALYSRETGHIPQRVASTLQKTPSRTEPATATGEAPVSPISPLEPQWQPASIPELTMRPPTATSTHADVDAGAEEQDVQVEASQSQLSLVNSVAPSEMSEQWNMSPKERLGLGSKIRKREVTPWEGEDDGIEEGMKGRLSPSLSVEGKRRLSWFSSKK